MSSSDSSRPASRTPKPVAPTQPAQDDCCGNDCGKGCVFEVYERKMERYESRLAEWQANEDEATATAALASAKGTSSSSVALNSGNASTRHTAPPSDREAHASSLPPCDSSAESSSSASDAAVPLPTRGRYRAASLVARFVPLDDDRLLAVNSWALAVATLYLMLVLMLSASLPTILALPLPALTAWLLFKQQPQVAESILVLARLPFFASRFYLEERDI